MVLFKDIFVGIALLATTSLRAPSTLDDAVDLIDAVKEKIEYMEYGYQIYPVQVPPPITFYMTDPDDVVDHLKKEFLALNIQYMRAMKNLAWLPPALFKAIPFVESGNDTSAVSPKGAFGEWQIMPKVYRKITGLDSAQFGHNRDINKKVGIIVLAQTYRYLKHTLGSDWDSYNDGYKLYLIEAGYNAGLEALEDNDFTIDQMESAIDYTMRIDNAMKRFEKKT